MCPAAQGDTDSPCLPLRGRWQREALAEGVCRGGRLCPPKQREALSFRASANTGVGIRLSLPPSAREVAARSAGGGRDSTRFSLPQSAAPTAPLPEGASQRGTAALTGRRTPRAFVPLRSTAGRRPLRPMCGCTRLSFRRERCPHRPAVGNRIPAAGHMGPALQGACVRPLSKSPNGLF